VVLEPGLTDLKLHQLLTEDQYQTSWTSSATTPSPSASAPRR
jgi:hypothetical protein